MLLVLSKDSHVGLEPTASVLASSSKASVGAAPGVKSRVATRPWYVERNSRCMVEDDPMVQLSRFQPLDYTAGQGKSRSGRASTLTLQESRSDVMASLSNRGLRYRHRPPHRPLWHSATRHRRVDLTKPPLADQSNSFKHMVAIRASSSRRKRLPHQVRQSRNRSSIYSLKCPLSRYPA